MKLAVRLAMTWGASHYGPSWHAIRRSAAISQPVTGRARVQGRSKAMPRHPIIRGYPAGHRHYCTYFASQFGRYGHF